MATLCTSNPCTYCSLDLNGAGKTTLVKQIVGLLRPTVDDQIIHPPGG
jgi:ABC-type Mn2+/Zn2+ transport system ATPase subunit